MSLSRTSSVDRHLAGVSSAVARAPVTGWLSGDQAQLLTWLTRAATMADAAPIDDLFNETGAETGAEAAS